jgi:CheY-like chemotaxis protein
MNQRPDAVNRRALGVRPCFCTRIEGGYLPPVVAVFNTSPDTVDMLRIVLERAGFTVVSAMTFEIREGHVDISAFLDQHDPAVVIYDIALPYEANWALFCHLRQLPALRDRPVIVTTTNARHVAPLAAEQPVYEIIGKPYDIDPLIGAVREAARTGASPASRDPASAPR